MQGGVSISIYARGRGQCCTITLLHIMRFSKTESAFFRFFDVLLAFRGPSFITNLIFTAAGLVPCDGRTTSPRTSSWSRLYIFWSSGIILLILSQFENRVPLKLVLGGVDSNALLHFCTCKDSKNRVCIFRFFDVFLTSKGSSFRTYFTFETCQ